MGSPEHLRQRVMLAHTERLEECSINMGGVGSGGVSEHLTFAMYGAILKVLGMVSKTVPNRGLKF
jgi:hypothetical protein